MNKRFEISKLAKELGYNEPAHEFWVKDPNGEVSTVSYWEVSKGKFDDDYYTDINLFNPTIEDLSIWLVEKYKVYIKISYNRETLPIKWTYTTHSILKGSITRNNMSYISYKEMLEDSMLQTLKYLKKEY